MNTIKPSRIVYRPEPDADNLVLDANAPTAKLRWPVTLIAIIPDEFLLTDGFVEECGHAYDDIGIPLSEKQVLNLARNLGYES